MIYCVWYPSGGFGHFVNAILSLYGKNFVRPVNQIATFSQTGDLHSLEPVPPIYFDERVYPEFTFDLLKNYSVLIDNGINNNGKNFLNTFPSSKIIKLCYDDISWPIVANTSIIKAKRSSLEKELPLDESWPTQESWAIREKYSLYLKEHYLRNLWTTDDQTYNLDVFTLVSYHELKDFFNNFVELTDFKEFHNQWLQHNYKYFFPVIESLKIIDAVTSGQHMDVTHVSSIWDQAVVNYFLNLKFDIEIPVNDFSDWFKNTKQIYDLLH
jgi:hypothetical protein